MVTHRFGPSGPKEPNLEDKWRGLRLSPHCLHEDVRPKPKPEAADDKSDIAPSDKTETH